MKIEKEVMYLGLDVHAEDIAVAIAEAGRDGEVRNHGTISSDLHSVEKLIRKLGHPDKELRICYEAGPCGFVLARFLKKKGIACDVVAPSLTPKGSGDKIKTDRRDARMLARLHRAGELTAVHVPENYLPGIFTRHLYSLLATSWLDSSQVANQRLRCGEGAAELSYFF